MMGISEFQFITQLDEIRQIRLLISDLLDQKICSVTNYYFPNCLVRCTQFKF